MCDLQSEESALQNKEELFPPLLIPEDLRNITEFFTLNEVRLKLEEMIDYFHEAYRQRKKPRTDRPVALSGSLRWANDKNRSERETRFTIRKQIGYIKKDLEWLEHYMELGYAMPEYYIDLYLAIREFYAALRQQTEEQLP